MDSYRSELDATPEESLFCRTLGVQLSDERGSRRLAGVCVSVRHGSSGGRKQLRVQLTDETDPFFVYSLALTDDDFESLKCQQGLLVDFAAFPHKLADLLQLCVDHERRDSPKFVVRLRVSGDEPALMEVVEANPFKHLVHLSLLLRAPGEGALRKHLAAAMRALKEDKRRLEASLSSCEAEWRARLERSETLAAEKAQEVERQRTAHSAQLASLGERHLAELRALRDETSKASSEQRVRAELERHEAELQQRRQMQALEAEASLQEALAKDLREKLDRSERHCRELALQVAALEAARAERDAQALSREKEAAEEREATTLAARLAELEAQLDASRAAQREAERGLEQCTSRLERRDAAVRTLSGDVVKANEIIRRLQGELRALHGQLGQREGALADKERRLEALGDTADRLRAQHRDGQAQLERARLELSEAQAQLAQCQRQVKTHENVIQWLNQQLNQRMGAGQGGSPGAVQCPGGLPKTPEDATSQPAKGSRGAAPQAALRTPVARGPQAARPP
ncbi:unnamed protein product [Ixodes pacificus]